MMRLASLAALPCLLLACTDDPPPEPREPWGVPITGGTLHVTSDGRHAIVADPDRGRLLSVPLAGGAAVEVALPGDEPGRVIEDGAGRLHVALRRGGALLTLDGAASLGQVARRPVCPEPRGLAWDPTTDSVHVACTGGELVTLPAAGGAATRALRLDRDLRDVVVRGDQLVVTRFRTAELVTLDAAGAEVSRFTPPELHRFGVHDREARTPPEIAAFPARAAVAWRTIGLPDGRVLMSHQRALEGVLGTEDDGYGGDCAGRVEAGLSIARPGEAPVSVLSRATGALPVDVAVTRTGDRVAVITAGNQRVHVLGAAELEVQDQGDGCRFPDTPDGEGSHHDDLGAPTAVAWTPDGALVVFYPELPGLVVRTDDTARTLTLPGEVGHDPGRAMFHRQTESKLACASCHPEGRDDGLVWQFAGLGPRRTQSLAGHLLQRAPYHWSGDLQDLRTLMAEVFTGRMSGGELLPSEKSALGPWLDRIPAPAPSPGAPDAVARGRALFESAAVGCASCHAGATLTNNLRFPVGTGATGEAFKVPSLLGVADRPPYMHDGCAPTLLDRFGACGGGDAHGTTSHLDAAQLADLVTYLESL